MKSRRERIDGVLLLDKPKGPTSNDALMRARRALNAAKAGHGGTLDPMASGLLPVAFGEATKFLHDLLESDKGYEGTMTLGARTDTGDAEGEVVERREVKADDAAIAAAVAALRGPILQVPPMYSALKRDGRPLYEYARAGQTLERDARAVRIDSFEVGAVDRSDPQAPRVPFAVRCSKGTYVRVLVEDVGAALGCGAHLSALRRTAVAALSLAQAVPLDVLEAAEPSARREMLAPVDALITNLPRVDLDAAAAARLLQGQRVRDEGPVQRVRTYLSGRLLGVADRTEDGWLAPARLIRQD